MPDKNISYFLFLRNSSFFIGVRTVLLDTERIFVRIVKPFVTIPVELFNHVTKPNTFTENNSKINYEHEHPEVKSMLKKYSKIIWKILISLLTIFCVIVVPLFLLSVGLWISNENSSISFLTNSIWKWILICTGFSLLILHYSYLYFFDMDEFKAINKEIHAILIDCKTAWCFGGSIASIITGVYFFIPSNSQLHARFDTVFGIYLGVLAVTFGVHIIYKTMAPIVGTSQLLEKILDDIRFMNNNSSLYIVYPALNIGFYREFVKSPNTIWNKNYEIFGKNTVFDKIRKEIKDAIQFKDVEAKALTYPRSKYEALFVEYHTNNKNNKKNKKIFRNLSDSDVINACRASADLLANTILTGKPKNQHDDYLIQCDPSKFPQQVIIIDNIVYIIVSYGLPIYNSEDNKFYSMSEEKSVAELITWRREDEILANTIKNHIEKLIAVNGIRDH